MNAKVTTTDPRSLKLQKAVADLGIASRREVERWISQGRVSVDGEVASIGARVTPKQTIRIDGREIARRTEWFPRMLLMNKRAGTEVSRRPSPKKASVFEHLPKLKTGRWISIGRLDVSTSGLLLFTNHGELAHSLSHPSSIIDREYAVRIKAHLTDEQISRFLNGVELDGKLCQFSDLQHYGGSGANHWYHVCLLEGRNREVRRIFESSNILVSRLKRVRYGPFVLPSFIQNGMVHEIHSDEVDAICRMLKVDVPDKPRQQRTKESKPKPNRGVLMEYPNLELPNWARDWRSP